MFPTGTAIFSSCRRYRYRLTRLCFPAAATPVAHQRSLVFVMLNPSVADETKDDPTLRRCTGFAEAWGFTRLDVVNLYARVATDPAELWKDAEPVGPDNDNMIVQTCTQPDVLVVCGWGACPKAAARVVTVRAMLRDEGVLLHHLGLTKEGHPRHPLYLPKTAIPTAWK